MNEAESKRRTREFAKRVARVGDALPGKRSSDVIAKQMIRSGFSVSSNYRASCRAKSTRDMIAKLAIVEEEGDETIGWLEMIVELDLMAANELGALIKEGNEIVAMTVASIKTLRRKQDRQQ
jgi:four helix bundle protein